jgi:hypothetical protein
MILGHHDPVFAAQKTTIFASNTLNNVEKHLHDVHILDEGGDIWRIKTEELPQASGPVAGDYSIVIPFRQAEFKAVLLKFIILDNIKYNKIVSGHLAALIKVANAQAVSAVPDANSTISLWIHDMYWHFEPRVIAEILTARSRIHVSFDGWGSKHEKISVLGIVTHFINDDYENVIRLIGLLELPEHKKTGIGKL